MPASQSCQPDGLPQTRSPHRAGFLMVVLVLAGCLSLVLYTHGAWWWYAPLALLAIVPAHVAILCAIAFVAARATGRGRAHGGTVRCQEGAGGPDGGESIVLHKPRRFDLLAWVVMLGREGRLREWTLDLADLQPGSAVLDVGCGTGTLLLAAAARVGPSGALHGVEPSPEMAAHARHKAEERGVPLQVVGASADSLPYPPASFDAIFCTLVLHHLPRPVQEGAIREMRRVLRPGGRAVIVDLQRPKSFARAIFSPLVLIYLMHALGPNGSPLDALGIEPLMREAGFEDVDRCSFGAGGVLGAVVGRLASGARAAGQAGPQGIPRVGPKA